MPPFEKRLWQCGVPILLGSIVFIVRYSVQNGAVLPTNIPLYNVRNVATQQRMKVPAVWKGADKFETCASDTNKRSDVEDCIQKTTGEGGDLQFDEHRISPVQVWKYSMGCYGNSTSGLNDITDSDQKIDVGHLVDTYLNSSWDTLVGTASDKKVAVSHVSMPLVLQSLQNNDIVDGRFHTDLSFCNCMDDMTEALLHVKKVNVDNRHMETEVEKFLTAFKINPPSDDYNKKQNAKQLKLLLNIMVLAIPASEFETFKSYIAIAVSGTTLSANQHQQLDGGDLKFKASAVTALTAAMKTRLDQVHQGNIYDVSSKVFGEDTRIVYRFCYRYGVPAYTYEDVNNLNTDYYFMVGTLLILISAVVNAWFGYAFAFEGHDTVETETSKQTQDMNESAKKQWNKWSYMWLLLLLEAVVWVLVVGITAEAQNLEYLANTHLDDVNVWFQVINAVLLVALASFGFYGFWTVEYNDKESEHELLITWVQCVAKDAPLIAGIFAFSIGVFAQSNLQDAQTLLTVTVLFAAAGLLQHFSNILADAVQPYENKILLRFLGHDVRDFTPVESQEQIKQPTDAHALERVVDQSPNPETLGAKLQFRTLGKPSLKPLMKTGSGFYMPIMNKMRNAVEKRLSTMPVPLEETYLYQVLLRSIIGIRLSIAVIIASVAFVGLGYIHPTLASGKSMLDTPVYVFVFSSVVLLCGFDLYYEISNSSVDNVRRAYVPVFPEGDAPGKKSNTEALRVFLKRTYREDRPVFQAWMCALFLLVLNFTHWYLELHIRSLGDMHEMHARHLT